MREHKYFLDILITLDAMTVFGRLACLTDAEKTTEEGRQLMWFPLAYSLSVKTAA